MMKSPSTLKAIFFDLDNVLVYSEIMHYKAWKTLVEGMGFSSGCLDFNQMMGISDIKQGEILADELKLTIEAAELSKAKREIYQKIILNGFEHPTGRNPLLEKLSSQYQIAIVSSNHRHIIDQTLEIEKIAHFFDFIICYEDCEKHKPHPDPYLHALKKANVAPHEALVIEDSPYGITAAQRAHIPVIGMMKDQRPDDLIKDVKYFQTFDEVGLILAGSIFS